MTLAQTLATAIAEEITPAGGHAVYPNTAVVTNDPDAKNERLRGVAVYQHDDDIVSCTINATGATFVAIVLAIGDLAGELGMTWKITEAGIDVYNHPTTEQPDGTS